MTNSVNPHEQETRRLIIKVTDVLEKSGCGPLVRGTTRRYRTVRRTDITKHNFKRLEILHRQLLPLRHHIRSELMEVTLAGFHLAGGSVYIKSMVEIRNTALIALTAPGYAWLSTPQRTRLEEVIADDSGPTVILLNLIHAYIGSTYAQSQQHAQTFMLPTTSLVYLAASVEDAVPGRSLISDDLDEEVPVVMLSFAKNSGLDIFDILGVEVGFIERENSFAFFDGGHIYRLPFEGRKTDDVSVKMIIEPFEKALARATSSLKEATPMNDVQTPQQALVNYLTTNTTLAPFITEKPPLGHRVVHVDTLSVVNGNKDATPTLALQGLFDAVHATTGCFFSEEDGVSIYVHHEAIELPYGTIIFGDRSAAQVWEELADLAFSEFKGPVRLKFVGACFVIPPLLRLLSVLLNPQSRHQCVMSQMSAESSQWFMDNIDFTSMERVTQDAVLLSLTRTYQEVFDLLEIEIGYVYRDRCLEFRGHGVQVKVPCVEPQLLAAVENFMSVNPAPPPVVTRPPHTPRRGYATVGSYNSRPVNSTSAMDTPEPVHQQCQLGNAQPSVTTTPPEPSTAIYERFATLFNAHRELGVMHFSTSSILSQVVTELSKAPDFEWFLLERFHAIIERSGEQKGDVLTLAIPLSRNAVVNPRMFTIHFAPACDPKRLYVGSLSTSSRRVTPNVSTADHYPLTHPPGNLR